MKSVFFHLSVKMQFSQTLLIAVALSSTIFLAQVSAHIHLEVPENVRKMAFILHEHCVAETGIDEDYTIQMLRGKLPEDRNFGCYLHCMFDTVGLVTTEGHIRFEDIMHLLPMRHQEVISEVVRACETVFGDNACETAYLTVECFINHAAAQDLLANGGSGGGENK